MKIRLVLLVFIAFVTISGCVSEPFQDDSTIVPSQTATKTQSAIPGFTNTPLPTATTSVSILNPGKRVEHPAIDNNPYGFYSYFPTSAVGEQTVFVGIWAESLNNCIEDYSSCMKQAKEYVTWLKNYSEQYKIPIVVIAIPGDEKLTALTLDPSIFSTTNEMLSRADLKVIDIVWNQYLPSLRDAGISPSNKVFVFGDAAPGIFAHRFAILHPELVQAVWESGGTAAPLPASELNGDPLVYPLGTRNLEELTGNPFNIEAYLKIYQLITIGEDDILHDIFYPDFFSPDQWSYMKAHFGATNQEMVNFFANSLTSIGAPAEFHLYSGVGYQISDEMVDDAFKFFVSHSQP